MGGGWGVTKVMGGFVAGWAGGGNAALSAPLRFVYWFTPVFLRSIRVGFYVLDQNYLLVSGPAFELFFSRYSEVNVAVAFKPDEPVAVVLL